MTDHIRVVNNHNEALYHWVNSGLKNTTLFHVDAHSDSLGWVLRLPFKNSKFYSKWMLRADNFICSAAYQGIIDKYYWLNPHAEEGSRLRKIYSGDGLQAKSRGIIIKWDRQGWFPYFGEPLKKKPEIKDPWILDVDLDAFNCVQFTENMPETYDGETHWEKRVEDTIELLSSFQSAPEMITLARSQGILEGSKGKPWCCPNLVDKIESIVQEKLTELYH